MDVQHIGNDLCRSRLVSLSLRTRTHGNDHLAVDVELAICTLRIPGERCAGIDDLRLSEVVRARIERSADADAEQAPLLARLCLLLLPLIPANQLLRDCEHLRVV